MRKQTIYLRDVLEPIKEMSKSDFRAACFALKQTCERSPEFNTFVRLSVDERYRSQLLGDLVTQAQSARAKNARLSYCPKNADTVHWERLMTEMTHRLNVDGLVVARARVGQLIQAFSVMDAEDAEIIFEGCINGNPAFDRRLAVMIYPEVVGNPKA